MVPKVFISHASEDKIRFVEAFAKRLRDAGIDAWLDQWEMQPGDSLVSKIFDEGIGEADSFIVVVSSVSVTKPWVQEELSAAMVKAVERGKRVIPVVIDGCEIPEALKSRIQLRIADLNNYDREFSHLVRALLNQSTRPPLGPVVSQDQLPNRVSGLDRQEEDVLFALCRLTVERSDRYFSPASVVASTSLAEDQVRESFEILEQHRFISAGGGAVDRFATVCMKQRGLHEYVRCEHDLAAIEKKILALAVNEGIRDGDVIAERLPLPEILVHAILENFRGMDLRAESTPDSNSKLGREFRITWISPRLRRMPG